jgi:hypothetical protein
LQQLSEQGPLSLNVFRAGEFCEAHADQCVGRVAQHIAKNLIDQYGPAGQVEQCDTDGGMFEDLSEDDL